MKEQDSQAAEKAKELVEAFYKIMPGDLWDTAKECALKCTEEIILAKYSGIGSSEPFWYSVQEEIEKL